MGIYTPPVTHWVFVNKDTGALKLCSNNDDGTSSETIVAGIEGYLTELQVRLQNYKVANLEPTFKLVFTLNDGKAKYNLQVGLNTFVAKWGMYVILNNFVDVAKPIAFCTKKYPDSNTILPVWYQNNNIVVIPKDVRDAFPRIKSGTKDIVDWAKLLGGDMAEVVPAVNEYLQQQIKAAEKTSINVNIDADIDVDSDDDDDDTPF